MSAEERRVVGRRRGACFLSSQPCARRVTCLPPRSLRCLLAWRGEWAARQGEDLAKADAVVLAVVAVPELAHEAEAWRVAGDKPEHVFAKLWLIDLQPNREPKHGHKMSVIAVKARTEATSDAREGRSSFWPYAICLA